MISEYGSYDWKKLWNNIVQFPNESFYYVSKDHIILKVIENNWELLGLDLRSEIPREVSTHFCIQIYFLKDDG